MQVQQLLKSAASALAEAGIAESRIEAQLLLQNCLDVSRSRLFLLDDQDINPVVVERFTEFLNRRCRREPLQYILGSCEFWSLDFFVTPAALIPRPETEFLLEHVFTTLDAEQKASGLNVLDLCTGSGVIAVVLARELAGTAVTAVDYSAEALLLAQKNIIHHGLAERVNLVCADLFSAFRATPLFDLIVTNPPYVITSDLPFLEPEVRDWEPEIALSGGPEGTRIIERITHDASAHLKPGGWLFMEIGADIEESVLSLFRTSCRYEKIMVVNDWAGKPRVLQARLAE